METIQITENLKAQFLRLYQMAFSDNNFHKLELKMLYKFAQKRGILEKELNNLLLHPTTEVTIPEGLEEKITYLYELCEMIWADGVVDDNERATLKKYITLFGFEQAHIDDLSEYLLQAAKEEKPITSLLKEL